MTTPFTKTGLAVLGEMPWGSHCCHFFQTRQDLLETLLPYFRVELEARELCRPPRMEPARLMTGEEPVVFVVEDDQAIREATRSLVASVGSAWKPSARRWRTI
jgi:hypothetical protein